MVTKGAWRRDADLFVAVAIGGAIGACARHAMDLLIPGPDDAFPTATFIVNLTGAFILGVVLELALRFAPDPTVNNTARRLRPFLITGMLGGYTTFSTYMVEAHGLVLANQPVLAGVYVFGSVLAGVLCVLLGMTFGHRVFGQPALTAQQRVAEEAVERESEDEA